MAPVESGFSTLLFIKYGKFNKYFDTVNRFKHSLEIIFILNLVYSCRLHIGRVIIMSNKMSQSIGCNEGVIAVLPHNQSKVLTPNNNQASYRSL